MVTTCEQALSRWAQQKSAGKLDWSDYGTGLRKILDSSRDLSPDKRLRIIRAGIQQGIYTGALMEDLLALALATANSRWKRENETGQIDGKEREHTAAELNALNTLLSPQQIEAVNKKVLSMVGS